MEPSNGNVSIKLSRTPILDLALLVIGLAVVAGVAELSTQMAVSFHPDAAQVSGVDLNPWRLAYSSPRFTPRVRGASFSGGHHYPDAVTLLERLDDLEL